jgi:uncharacterized protein (TIGR01619 family)
MGIFDFLKRSSGNGDSVPQAGTHEENWAAYLSTIDDDAVGSIVVDLGLREVAPVAGLSELLIIEIPKQHVSDNGLPDGGEFEVLADIEESFQSTLAATIQCIFAGHLHCEGTTSLYFFIEKGVDLDDLLTRSIQPFKDYSFNHRLKPDPEWDSYFNFMYPSPIQLQRLGNEAVIRNLIKHGDNLEKERKVEHWIYFPSETDRSQFLSTIAEKGFTVEDVSVDNEHALPYKAQISREDKVTLDATDEYILDLWQRAQDCNGNYDGWETFIVKN